MKKFWKIGLSAFLAVGLLAACGQEAKDNKPANEQQTQQEKAQVDEATFPMTITDALGKDITLRSTS